MCFMLYAVLGFGADAGCPLSANAADDSCGTPGLEADAPSTMETVFSSGPASCSASPYCRLDAFRTDSVGMSRAQPSQRYANDDAVRAMLYFTGAVDIEDVPESVMEMWWDLLESPLELNTAGASRLESSGMLTKYQAASLVEYRTRSGDILSFNELACVDGFNVTLVSAMKPFVSLASYALPGRSSTYRNPVRNSLSVNESNKANLPSDGKPVETQWSWNGKYRLYSDGAYDVGLSMKKNYVDDGGLPGTFAGYAAYYGRRHMARLVVGDFAPRFGQGLTIWSGFSMSGVSTVTSFWKRPTGISPSRALTAGASMRGIAAELRYGHCSVSIFSSFPGVKPWLEDGDKLSCDIVPGMNVAWYSRTGEVSVSAVCDVEKDPVTESDGAFRIGSGWQMSMSKISADARFCVRGMELFGEAGLNIVSMRPAAVAGFMLPLGDKWKMAASGRWLPTAFGFDNASPVRAYSGKTGECGFSLGASAGAMEMTLDCALQDGNGRKQLKYVQNFTAEYSPALSQTFRFKGCLRNYGTRQRLDLRSDLKWTVGQWQTIFRTNVLYADKLASLVYVDGGYQGRVFSVFLRGTAFVADGWDNRIYCYERDAVGGFNVPAYYGRGYALSMLARLKFEWNRNGKSGAGHYGFRKLGLYCRTGFSDTPWKSPGDKSRRLAKAELKFQLMYDF